MVKFSIVALGWVKCIITLDNKQIQLMHSSDYGDKFQELINICFSIVDDRPIHKSLNEGYDLVWRDDFNKYYWQFQVTDRNALHIEISEISDDDTEFYRSLIKFDILIEELVKYLFTSLKEMFDLYGIVGYKKAWEVGNFPLAEYIELSAKYNNITLNEVNVFEEDDEGRKKLNLKDEIQIILNASDDKSSCS